MNKLYLFIIVLSLYLSCGFNVKADDSIPETDLQEVVVKSERSWVENGVINIIPSKKEKQLSNSPGSLIDVMNIPMLKGAGETITTTSGKPVAIFINGQLATQTDLATFWPKNAKKVEYMVHPSDGAYAGYSHVINFVVSEYYVGGVTKGDVTQTIPNNGRYRLSSKLNYKRMTFGALLEYKYNYDRPTTSSLVSSYRDIFYNSVMYDEINQISYQEQKERRNNFNVLLNAQYLSQKFRATHSVSLGWNRNPGSYVKSNDIWSENLFDSDSFNSSSKLQSLSPQVSGSYLYTVTPNKLILGGSWNYSFSHNKSDSWSRYGDNSKVENSIDEKVNVLTAYLALTYYLNRKFIMQLTASSSFNWFSTLYEGTAEDKSRQRREEYSAQLGLYWYPSNYWTLIVTPGFMESSYVINGMKENYFNPTALIEGTWNPNRKFNMRLGVRTWMFPAKSSSTNPVLTQSTDLLWISGNPYLKPQLIYSGQYSAYYNPVDWFAMNGSVVYERQYHQNYNIYESAPAEMGGIIKTEANAPAFERIDSSIDFYFYLFNRKLSIGGVPQYSFFKSRGEYARTLNHFTFNVDASYTLKNIRISAFYQGRNKILGGAGTSIFEQRDQFSIGVTYSYKDLYVRVDVDDIFHRKFKTFEEAWYNVYSIVSNSEMTGRKVRLNLTYTFGYGKKTDRNINISGPSEVESSIIYN